MTLYRCQNSELRYITVYSNTLNLIIIVQIRSYISADEFSVLVTADVYYIFWIPSNYFYEAHCSCSIVISFGIE